MAADPSSLTVGPDVTTRACIFCGGRPVTKEHLWPAWMAREFPSLDEIAGHYSNLADGDYREWVARAFSRTVSAVCGDCNSGWMSDIEAKAKPLLTSLFTGRSLKLGPQRQTSLATWVMLKALVHTHAEVTPNPIPEQHYKGFFRLRRPLDGVVIWLGAHIPRLLDDGHLLVLEGRSQPLEPFADSTSEIVEGFQTGSAYGWTLGFGIAAIQLFGSDFLDMQDAPPSEEVAPALRRIWPVKPRATWPPPIRLNDAIGDLPQLPRAFFSRLPD